LPSASADGYLGITFGFSQTKKAFHFASAQILLKQFGRLFYRNSAKAKQKQLLANLRKIIRLSVCEGS
jgi:hypothetical protein